MVKFTSENKLPVVKRYLKGNKSSYEQLDPPLFTL